MVRAGFWDAWVHCLIRRCTFPPSPQHYLQEAQLSSGVGSWPGDWQALLNLVLGNDTVSYNAFIFRSDHTSVPFFPWLELSASFDLSGTSREAVICFLFLSYWGNDTWVQRDHKGVHPPRPARLPVPHPSSLTFSHWSLNIQWGFNRISSSGSLCIWTLF